MTIGQPAVRCAWAESDPLLDGFQAGLSWSIILRKRDAFRLDAERVRCS